MTTRVPLRRVYCARLVHTCRLVAQDLVLTLPATVLLTPTVTRQLRAICVALVSISLTIQLDHALLLNVLLVPLMTI